MMLPTIPRQMITLYNVTRIAQMPFFRAYIRVICISFVIMAPNFLLILERCASFGSDCIPGFEFFCYSFPTDVTLRKEVNTYS